MRTFNAPFICTGHSARSILAELHVPDPAAPCGSTAEQQRRFRDVAHMLKRRIELLQALPVDKLAPLSLQSQLDAIGRQ